ARGCDLDRMCPPRPDQPPPPAVDDHAARSARVARGRTRRAVPVPDHDDRRPRQGDGGRPREPNQAATSIPPADPPPARGREGAPSGAVELFPELDEDTRAFGHEASL